MPYPHAKPSAFFLNGSALPLEWGYPPLETVQLAPIPGSNGWASASVTFLAGSPVDLYYKYSARIAGTNNYEAIRLTGFDNVSRPLRLNTNGAPMTVVDYLGAAAHPLRNPGDTNLPSAQNRLFSDPQRGDAGVRVRREVLFQLDLSMRNTNNLAPRRGARFRQAPRVQTTGQRGAAPPASYPDNSAYVNWDNAGIQLVDDGTSATPSPATASYSRLWALSTNGYDAAIEVQRPLLLVGGASAVYFPEEIPGTEPYQGDTYWIARRSPRSFIYKFYVYTTGGNNYDSPNYDLSYYVDDPGAERIRCRLCLGRRRHPRRRRLPTPRP